MEHATNRNRTLWLGLGLLVVVALFASPFFGWHHTFGAYGVAHPFGFGFMPWFFGFGLLARALIFSAILLLVVAAFRRRSRTP